MDGKFIKVNDNLETSIPHIYAIGDLIKGYQLAHSASAHGVFVAETISKLNPKPIIQENIPRCIYTRLESASVGLSEDQAKKQGYDVEVKQTQFQGNAMSLIKGETEGFIKIIIDKQFKEILGVFIVGPHATELISEILGIKYSEGTIEELSNIIQPHPSLTEAIGENANALLNKAIHM